MTKTVMLMLLIKKVEQFHHDLMNGIVLKIENQM